MNPNISEMGILQMLKVVLGGEFAEERKPSIRIAPGQEVRSLITRPISQRLYATSSIVLEYVEDLENEHLMAHHSGRKHECSFFNKKISRLRSVYDILAKLVWQSVIEEFPRTAANNDISIVKGWFVVSDGKWEDVNPFDDKSILARTFIDEVKEIVCGNKYSATGEKLDSIGPGERVIGCVEDARAKALFLLGVNVLREVEKLLPSGYAENPKETISNLSLKEAKRLILLSEYYDLLIDLGVLLFWSAVQETVPAAADVAPIGVREGWKIVIPNALPKPVDSPLSILGEQIVSYMG